MLRLAPHFVERDKTIINIERRVFESLRHDWRGALLEFQDEMFVRGARFLVEVFRKTQQQNIAQKIEDRFFQGRVPPLRRRDRALDDGTVFVAHRALLQPRYEFTDRCRFGGAEKIDQALET